MEGTEKISEAIVKAQSEFEAAKKDSTNPHFKTRYADLSSVMAACQTALNANGIAVMQFPATVDRGVQVVTRLVHTSGQFMESPPLVMPVAQQTPQAYGSALTYARRYSLAAFVGVSTEDDDGHAGSARAPQASTPQTGSAMESKLRESISQQEKMEALRAEFAAAATLDALGVAWTASTTLREQIGKEGATRIFKHRQSEIEKAMPKEKKAKKEGASDESDVAF